MTGPCASWGGAKLAGETIRSHVLWSVEEQLSGHPRPLIFKPGFDLPKVRVKQAAFTIKASKLILPVNILTRELSLTVVLVLF